VKKKIKVVFKVFSDGIYRSKIKPNTISLLNLCKILFKENVCYFIIKPSVKSVVLGYELGSLSWVLKSTVKSMNLLVIDDVDK